MIPEGFNFSQRVGQYRCVVHWVGCMYHQRVVNPDLQLNRWSGSRTICQGARHSTSEMVKMAVYKDLDSNHGPNSQPEGPQSRDEKMHVRIVVGRCRAEADER